MENKESSNFLWNYGFSTHVMAQLQGTSLLEAHMIIE
jgi:hypothetical protein